MLPSNLKVSFLLYLFVLSTLLTFFFTSDSPMTALDAIAAAEYGDFVITSPNSPFLYQPSLDPHPVQIRSDFRFGVDDPVQYPQWLRVGHYHHMLILTKTLEGEQSVMWWDGAKDSFVQASDVSIGGVGFIQGPQIETMEILKTSLISTIQALLPPNFSSLQQRELDSIVRRKALLQKSWDRLTNFPGDVHEKSLQVVEFQRTWLELEAFHRFVTRVLLDLQTKTRPPKGTWKSIGAFTANEKEVQDCLNAGVPIFFVRPKHSIKGPLRIDSVVPLLTPHSLALDLHPTFPSPIVFNGDPRLPSQYEAQVQWLRNRHLPHLLFQDHLSRVSGPGMSFFSNILFYLLILSIVRPEPSAQSHLSKPYDRPSPAPSPSSSYSTFLHPIMPKPILAWERALLSSKLPSFSVKQKQEMKIVSKTIFPPPDLLLKGDSTNNPSAFNNWILSRQGIQWLQSRPSFPPTPLPLKFWKELIHTGFANGNPGQIKGQKTVFVKRIIQPYGLDFTPDGVLCLKDSSVRITPFPKSLTTTWRNLPLQLFPNFPPGGSIFSEVLWEITWINFRFDLFRLDSHLLVPEGPHPYSARFLKVWQVLEDIEDCDQEKLAYIRSFPESDFGITHPDPDVRLIFLGRFAQLECEWGKPLSPTLSKWKKNPELVPCAELEAEVFLYFSQTFVNSFGVLPSVPRHVPTSTSSQNPDVGPSYS